jgi:fluoride exporter
MDKLILVFIGGGTGAVLRYGLSLLATGPLDWKPFYTTLISNVLASLLLGIVYFNTKSEHTWAGPLLMTGLCGGWSTFSTFSLESVLYARQGQWGFLLIHLLLNLLLCFGAVILSMKLSR